MFSQITEKYHKNCESLYIFFELFPFRIDRLIMNIFKYAKIILILLYFIWFCAFEKGGKYEQWSGDDNIERIFGCVNNKNKDLIVQKKDGVDDVEINLPDKHVAICIYSDNDAQHQRACELIDSNRGDEYDDFMMMTIGTKVLLLFFFSNF